MRKNYLKLSITILAVAVVCLYMSAMQEGTDCGPISNTDDINISGNTDSSERLPSNESRDASGQCQAQNVKGTKDKPEDQPAEAKGLYSIYTSLYHAFDAENFSALGQKAILKDRDTVTVFENKTPASDKPESVGVYRITSTKPSLAGDFIVDGYFPVQIELDRENSSIWVDLVPAASIKLSLKTESGSPPPKGKLLIAASSSGWVSPDGSLSEKGLRLDHWRLKRKHKRFSEVRSALLITTGESQYICYIPLGHKSKSIDALAGDYGIVFLPDPEWPEWADNPYPREIFSAGRIVITDPTSITTAALTIRDLPDLPVLPVVSIPDGFKLLYFHAGVPNVWKETIHRSSDGCAVIQSPEGLAVVAASRQWHEDEDKWVVASPVWKTLTFVLQNENGEPIVEEIYKKNYLIRLWFTSSEKTSSYAAFQNIVTDNNGRATLKLYYVYDKEKILFEADYHHPVYLDLSNYSNDDEVIVTLNSGASKYD